MDTKFYVLTVLAMFAGSFLHVIKKVIQRRQTNDKFSLKDFLTKYPYKTIMSVAAGVVGYLMLMQAGELTYVAAVLTGYTANSLGGAAD